MKWINRHLGMTKADWIRAAEHTPHGVAVVFIMAYIQPQELGIAIGVMAGLSFLFYQIMQDWRKGDKSFKDVVGFVAGIFIGAGIVYLRRVL